MLVQVGKQQLHVVVFIICGWFTSSGSRIARLAWPHTTYVDKAAESLVYAAKMVNEDEKDRLQIGKVSDITTSFDCNYVLVADAIENDTRLHNRYDVTCCYTSSSLKDYFTVRVPVAPNSIANWLDNLADSQFSCPDLLDRAVKSGWKVTEE
eukprot:TRINITY_DN11529_c0_g3_i1.p1 TRINITY_DN11529_c0_g3~~TRINITY_DN11529_c0_g3_i1.p1  ORF type:complete len:152 (+),score=26.05 TRINITY_DN11529_c0_g3_i1:75-530(+)